MIPAAAVDEFLNRKLNTHLWVKTLAEKELDRAIADLRPRPELWPNLRLHQKACFLLGVAYPQFGYWLDMGTGKTLLALELLRYWFEVGRIRRALIFVTSDKAFPTWERQIAHFDIGLPYCALEGSSKEKWKGLHELGEGLALVTYPGAVAMVSKRVPVRGKNKKKKDKLQLDTKLLARLAEWSGGIVLDESTRVGHHSSLAHRMVARISPQRSQRIIYALAGRPFGRDPAMLHAQYKLLDDGVTLGATLGLFREAFYSSAPSQWSRSEYARDYTFDAKKEGLLSRLVQNRSITYTADECIDLPPVVPIEEEVAFSSEALAYYRRVVKELVASKGNLRETKNAFLRLRQISSGFVGLHDDETGKRAMIEFTENPKLERTIELFESLPARRKMVVFYDFTWSGRRLDKELRALGADPIWLWSGTKDYRADLRKFFDKPECRVAVINNRIGAYSLDGLQQVANYTVFFESPVSAIDREQAERRLVRDGQEHRVFQYDLLVRGSADRKILDFHAEGEALMDALLRDPARVLRTQD